MGSKLYTELRWKIIERTITEEDIKKAKKSRTFDINERDGDYRTLLHLAAEYGQTETAKLLVKHGALINKGNAYGRTACMFAAINGHIDTVKVFVEELKADINAQDKFGWTACIFAAIYKKNEMLEALVKLGADISIKNNEGKTVLDYIDMETKKKLIELRREYEKSHPKAKKMADDLAKIYLPKVAVKLVNTPKNGRKAQKAGVEADKSVRKI